MPFLPLKSCIHHCVWSFTTTSHCKLASPPDLPWRFQQKIHPTTVATTQVSVVDSGRSNVSQVCVPSPQSIPVNLTGWGRDISEGLFGGIMCEICEICDMCILYNLVKCVKCVTFMLRYAYLDLLVLVHGIGLELSSKLVPSFWGEQFTRKCLVVRLLLPSDQNDGDISRKLWGHKIHCFLTKSTV